MAARASLPRSTTLNFLELLLSKAKIGSEGRPAHHRSLELPTSVNGSLSPDSCCTGLVATMAEMGQQRTTRGPARFVPDLYPRLAVAPLNDSANMIDLISMAMRCKFLRTRPARQPALLDPFL